MRTPVAVLCLLASAIVNLLQRNVKVQRFCRRETKLRLEGIMRIVHAIVAVLTVVLLFIQQAYVSVCAGPCPAKQSLPARPPSSGDAPLAPLPLLAADCVVCARAARRRHEERGRPKYKRDPEIAVDNELIGNRPHDDD